MREGERRLCVALLLLLQLFSRSGENPSRLMKLLSGARWRRHSLGIAAAPSFQDALNTFSSFPTSHFEHFKNIKVCLSVVPDILARPLCSVLRCLAWMARHPFWFGTRSPAMARLPQFDGQTSGLRSPLPLCLCPLLICGGAVVTLVITSIAFPTVVLPLIYPSIAALSLPWRLYLAARLGRLIHIRSI